MDVRVAENLLSCLGLVSNLAIILEDKAYVPSYIRAGLTFRLTNTLLLRVVAPVRQPTPSTVLQTSSGSLSPFY